MSDYQDGIKLPIKEQTQYSHYKALIEMLRMADDRQLVDLMYDIGDVSIVDRIAGCAYHYVEHYDSVECENIFDDTKDQKQADDAQRGRDIKSNERPY